ncbi:MAG: Hsp20/alpha crystallin family protein [Deltaproteobacteria bacterium]|nr:Hsp20/alpha crystallin family protein [Deltaproteobacteria bacterium]
MPIFTFRDPWSDPFREMARLQRQMERLFEETLGPGLARWQPGVYPLVNISEDRDHLYVRAELPGITPQELDITIHEGNLILRGERKIPVEAKDVNYHRRERESGFFRRLVALPSPVNPNSVEASYKDGILTIKMAKPEEIKPRKIQVKTA